MALYKGSDPVAGLAKNTIVTGFNIFDCKWSDHLLNDIQWLRADTFSWQSGDVYVTAYNTLVNEYATGTEETEGGVTFKRSTNGFKIADSSQEQAISEKYNTDGIAWYYILDTANKRFKLPRTKFGFEGLRDNVGNDIDESLPNIKGGLWARSSISYGTGIGVSSNGCINLESKTSSGADTAALSTTTGAKADRFTIDASRSSSTYQDNAPVQERATQMYLYFYVGEYSRDAIEQTAGITAEQLNNKVSKTGDTMTGDLIIERNTTGIIDIKNNTFDTTIPPTEGLSYSGAYRFLDKNNAVVGQVSNYIDTNGITLTSLYNTRTINNTYYGANFVVGITKDGKEGCWASKGVSASIARWSAPSLTNGIGMTIGASGTLYNAPTSGWVHLRYNCGSGTSFVTLHQGLAHDEYVYQSPYQSVHALFKVNQGNFAIDYGNLTFTVFTFIYDEGAY